MKQPHHAPCSLTLFKHFLKQSAALSNCSSALGLSEHRKPWEGAGHASMSSWCAVYNVGCQYAQQVHGHGNHGRTLPMQGPRTSDV